MLMRPTRVAAVICHALSPELSHDAYGFTVSFPNGARPESLPGFRAAPGCAAAGARTTPGPSQHRDPGCPGVAEAGRPLRCRSRTSLVSHGRVSDSFPGRYAARTVLLQASTMISATFRVVRYASSHVTDLPAAGTPAREPTGTTSHVQVTGLEAQGSVTDPVTGEPGVRLEFSTAAGEVFASEHRTATALAWWDGLPPGVGWGQSGVITRRAAFRAATGGPYLFAAAGVGRLTITVNGLVAAQGETRVPADPVETMTRPGEIRGEVTLAEGQAATVSVEFRPAAACQGPVALRLGVTPSADEQALMAEAVAAAEEADLAIVVVGSAENSESEGYDRDTLALPGRQDELAAPGEVAEVTLRVPARVFAVFDEQAGRWSWLPGEFTVQVGRSSRDLRLSLAVRSGYIPAGHDGATSSTS